MNSFVITCNFLKLIGLINNLTCKLDVNYFTKKG